MASENKEFTLSVFETLSTPWVDVGIDLSEESIDDLIDNEALKTIPFMKTGIALCKAGIQVRDKYLLKQTLKFVTTYQMKSWKNIVKKCVKILNGLKRRLNTFSFC